MKEIIKKILRKRFFLKIYSPWGEFYRKIIKIHPELNSPEVDEKKYLEQWGKYGIKVKPYSYRICSKFVGQNINIEPMELFPALIEPILSPKETNLIAEEKNLYDNFLSKLNYGYDILPDTLFRSMGGVVMDKNYMSFDLNKESLYKILEEVEKVIIKPTVISGGGEGIIFCEKVNDIFYSDMGEILTVDLLQKNFGKDYICQRVFEQSEFNSQFNPTSVNTFRVMTYCSVKDNKVHVPNVILRVGGKNSKLDHAASGGFFCGVSNDGVLKSEFINKVGTRKAIHNGVDISKKEYVIPNFEKIISFSKKVACLYPHSRLLALDIALNKDNNPVLLEVNSSAFTPWFFTFTNGSVFGEFTEEVMKYCIENSNNYTIGNIKF